MRGHAPILIADDHAVVRSGVRRIFADHPGWSVVAEASNGKDAVAEAIATEPDVAVLDYALPVLNGIEATQPNPTAGAKGRGPHLHHARQRGPAASVVQRWRARLRAEVRPPAAVDFCRPVAGRAQALLHGQGVAGPAGNSPDQNSRVEQTLTDREQTIVRLVAEGHSNKQIANLLSISVKTVETHRATVMRKLDLDSTAAMVRYAIRNNLVEA